jgi:heme a synthase
MYKKLAVITIGAVYFLILVGGIVRASGSGMGCPDWPKCFGTWIPPTNIDQLPSNYQELFGARLKGEVKFNLLKTWTEYVNRLVGVLIGLLIFLTLAASWKEYWHTKRSVVNYSLVAFILVGIEGLLGSKVVSTELNPVLITVHMVLAILVVICLIYALYLAYYSEEKQRNSENDSLMFLVLLLMFLSFGQLILGTQIRELIDVLSSKLVKREEWIEIIKGGMFYFHIIMALLILLGHIWFNKLASKNALANVRGFLNALLTLVILEFVSGGVLGLMDIPAFIQPVHLTFATLIIGVQFTLYLFFNKPSKVEL